jgi:hypothetical protein
MLSGCAHVLGSLGPFRAQFPPSVKIQLPSSPSFAALAPKAEQFAAFRGGRDLFIALALSAAVGHEGSDLIQAVNKLLKADEELQGSGLDRLEGGWLSLWDESVDIYGKLWGEVRRPLDRAALRLRRRIRDKGDRLSGALDATVRLREGGLPDVVIVALVEPAIGMHRAGAGVVVLEAWPYLWPYVLAHELVHAVVPDYRLDSPDHQLAGELLTDLAADNIGHVLAKPRHDEGPKPAQGFDQRWEGWKLSYGMPIDMTADEALAAALPVWNSYLAGRPASFEDAVDELAVVVGR